MEAEFAPRPSPWQGITLLQVKLFPFHFLPGLLSRRRGSEVDVSAVQTPG